MVRPNGYLIGATVVGEDAAELVQILALAVWQKVRIDVLADFPGITITHSRLLVEAARQWRQPSLWVRLIDPLRQLGSDLRRKVRNWILNAQSKQKKVPRRSAKVQAELAPNADLLVKTPIDLTAKSPKGKSIKSP
jgi:hypothetical protein